MMQGGERQPMSPSVDSAASQDQSLEAPPYAELWPKYWEGVQPAGVPLQGSLASKSAVKRAVTQ